MPITTNVASSNSGHGVPDATVCDKFCQWLGTGLWFSPGNLVSSSTKTDSHGETEM